MYHTCHASRTASVRSRLPIQKSNFHPLVAPDTLKHAGAYTSFLSSIEKNTSCMNALKRLHSRVPKITNAEMLSGH